MKDMFPTLGFSQMVAQKLMDDQGIGSIRILASLSDKNITVFCDVIRRPGGLVGGKMPDRGNQISVLMMKNLKLTAFIFKMMEYCSRIYGMRCIDSASFLQYLYQWELEWKKQMTLKCPQEQLGKDYG